MGVSDVRSLDIDPKTDTISAAWTGHRAGENNAVVGPGEDRERRAHHGARATTAGRTARPATASGYRADAPAIGGRRRGQPRLAGHAAAPPRRRRQRTSGAPGAFWKCSSRDKSRTTRRTTPAGALISRAPKPVNVWYGPQGGCYDFPRNAGGVAVLQRLQHEHWDWDQPRAGARGRLGGDQRPVVSGGTYRRPAQAKAGRGPSYWDGRWFLADFAGAGQRAPRAADGPGDGGPGWPARRGRLVLRIIPAGLLGAHRMIDLDFGPTARCTSRPPPARGSGLGSATPACGGSATRAAPTRPARTRRLRDPPGHGRRGLRRRGAPAASRTSGRSPTAAPRPASASRTRIPTTGR